MRLYGSDQKDMEVEDYLEKAGFQILFSDVLYFTDRRGKLFNARDNLADFELGENGPEELIVREVTSIMPEEDVFQLLHYNSYCGEPPKIGFLNKSPCPTNYNAAIISHIASWPHHDGIGTNTLYSVLMLQISTRRKKLTRDEWVSQSLSGLP